MNWIHAIILGVVEGISEFLPISSTGHLTVVERLLGYDIEAPDITAFTAVIQVGAMLAAIIYFRADIIRLAKAWFSGLAHPDQRNCSDYRLAWTVIIGSLPVCFTALALHHVIEGPLRTLWVVAAALALWSIVMFMADRRRGLVRNEADLTWRDGLIIGIVQCVSLIPGVSRSGATISAGLFRGIDRVSATRLSFFLGIPALVAAGCYQGAKEASNISAGVGWGPTLIGTAVSFAIAYASIAWLLRFVSKNNFTSFVIYRVILALAIVGLLVGHIIPAA
ncbi:MAG: undecaprenyl-diphosphate phosphatase [Propionibacteriaceae bacterium]